MNVVAIVGMAGAGKTEVARLFEREGYIRVRFGDITDEAVRAQGLRLCEESERRMREAFRKEYGMAAYARLNLERIEKATKKAPVVIDGLYSWEEYKFLKDYYRDIFSVVAVWASPKTRRARLCQRAERPLTEEESISRDYAEVEEINKGGPIAMADFTIINESELKDLVREVKRIIARLGEGA